MRVIFDFERFPLSVCTQTGDLDASEKLIPARIVEEENGLIRFDPYIDPKLIYLTQHNSSIGKTWNGHNDQFAEFVSRVNPNKIVDIGGGSGNIYKSYLKINPDINWKIIDLNPTLKDPQVEIVQSLYNPNQINEGDIVITSHFLEHLNELEPFLQSLRERNPRYHVFSIPNFKEFSKSNYSATLMFEHPRYLVEEYVEAILASNGWKLTTKKYYDKHSIFFLTEPTIKVENSIKMDYSLDIINMVKYLKSRASTIHEDQKIYVFGAHFTYYYLLNLGIKEDQIVAVLDNDPNKVGKRMYGTNTKVISPKEASVKYPVFLEMGPYNEEIKENINHLKFI
jgi:hypothetical protein